MKKTDVLTQERLKQLLHYDPESGQFTWLSTRGKAIKGNVAGYLDKKTGYIQIGIDRVLYAAHRLAWLYEYGIFPPQTLDHENLCPADNRIKNLRPATDAQNNANKPIPSSNKSGFKGVSWHAGGKKWQASIKVGRKSIGLGIFETKEAAYDAYCAGALKYHGEFARLH